MVGGRYSNPNMARRRRTKRNRDYSSMESWRDKTPEQRALEAEADRILGESMTRKSTPARRRRKR